MKMILFLIGLALLGGLYLWAVEYWRIGCAILWAVIPMYCIAGAAAIDGD